MKLRLKFTKGEEVKYISHLDLMRTFQRAISRSGIPIAYSQGFNPHQELSFGAPLPLGVTSMAEYVDIQMAEDVSVEEVMTRLNDSLPPGLKIVGGTPLGEGAKNAMSIVASSLYILRLNLPGMDRTALCKELDDFLAQERISVLKPAGKKKERRRKLEELTEVNIRPMIQALQFVDYDGDTLYLKCLLDCGSRSNLKPELLSEALKEFIGRPSGLVKIQREELFTLRNDKMIDLLEAAKS